MNMHNSPTVKATTEKLYQDLQNAGFEVLWDDRTERAGVLFATADLIGIPHQLVIGEKSLKEGCIEYRSRRDKKAQLIPLGKVIETLRSTLRFP